MTEVILTRITSDEPSAGEEAAVAVDPIRRAPAGREAATIMKRPR